MSRLTPAGRTVRTVARQAAPARSTCTFEPLEDRRLFSYVPLGGAVDSNYHAGQGVALAYFPGEGPVTASAVAAAPGAKAVVAGTITPVAYYQQYGFAFARFTAAGILDPSFGSGGEVVIHSPTYCHLTDVIVQGDGKIVASGTEETTEKLAGRRVAVLFRLNADGTLDTSFGKFNGSSGADYFAAGSPTTHFVVEAFDPPGTVSLNPAAYDHIAFTAGEQIVASSNVNGVAYVREYTSQGTAEQNFGNGNGVFTLNTGRYDYVRGIAGDAAGGVYLAGQTDTTDLNGGSDTNFLVAHLTSAGKPDPAYEFSPTGAYILGYNDGKTEYATGVVVRPDGVAVASSFDAGTGHLRYAGLTNAGPATYFNASTFSFALDLAAQKTNQTVVLDTNGSIHQFAPNGSENFVFNSRNGPGAGDTDARPVGLAVDSNDDVLTAGTRNGAFYVKRFFGHDPVVPPAAPTNLYAVQAGTGKVTLHWTDNAGNETAYGVQQSGGLFFGGGYTALSANAAQYTAINLTPGKWYRFRVRAFNAAGGSAFSNIVVVKVALPKATPHAKARKVHARAAASTDAGEPADDVLLASAPNVAGVFA